MFDTIKTSFRVSRGVFFMIQSDLIRGHLDTIVLKLIQEKDRYGYEIASCIKERTNGAFLLKEATLYSALNRLEKKDIIESYIGKKTHGKKRRYYKITALGKAYFKEKYTEWNAFKKILETLLEEDHETN